MAATVIQSITNIPAKTDIVLLLMLQLVILNDSTVIRRLPKHGKNWNVLSIRGNYIHHIPIICLIRTACFSRIVNNKPIIPFRKNTVVVMNRKNKPGRKGENNWLSRRSICDFTREYYFLVLIGIFFICMNSMCTFFAEF